MNLLFWLAKKKARPTGEAPIYAKIQVKGKRPSQFATGIWVQPEQWYPKGFGFIAGDDNLTKSWNEKLLNIRADINGICNDLERRDQVITPQLIKYIYTGKVKSAETLLAVMNVFMQRKKKEKVARNTVKNYETRMGHTVKYLDKLGDPNRLCHEVTINFLANFEDYLKYELNFHQSHTNKILRFVRQVMDLAVQMDLVDHNPLLSYRFKKLPPRIKVYLDEQELEAIANHEFANFRLAKVARLFVFQCYTGLSYAELRGFRRHWVRPGVDGKLWIYADRQKVAGAQCVIPLFQKAREILEAFNWQLPQISNGNYNAYLKEVAFITGIEKPLTTHVGRKTFGNILLNHGVSLEAISSMYGHSNTRTTQSYYVEVSEQQIARETAHLNF